MTKTVNYSADSVDTSDYEDGSTEKKIKSFAKQMLKTTLFVGTFEEKRFVESLNEYRDVIKIDSDEEDFIENLKAVKKKISSTIFNKWVGITSPNNACVPAGYCVWVCLQKEILGKYWFKVKSVEFLNNEIRLKLEIIRPYKSESPSKRSKTSTNSNDDKNISLQEYFTDISNHFKANTKDFMVNVCTFNNIKESIIFISLLVATIITGAVQSIKYLLDYILKLLKTISEFIKAVTPIVVATIHVLGNTVTSISTSILHLFQGRSVYRDPRILYQPVYPRLKNGNYQRKALPYKSSVVITEVED